MTTGRINQVTTSSLPPDPRPREALHFPTEAAKSHPFGKCWSFVDPNQSERHQATSTGYPPPRSPSITSTLVPPVSHIIGTLPPVYRETKMASYREDYQRQAAFLTRLTVAADPRVVDKLQVWPSAINPHPSPQREHYHVSDNPQTSRLPWAYQFPEGFSSSQASPYPDSNRHIHGSVQIPPAKKKEAYLTYMYTPY